MRYLKSLVMVPVALMLCFGQALAEEGLPNLAGFTEGLNYQEITDKLGDVFGVGFELHMGPPFISMEPEGGATLALLGGQWSGVCLLVDENNPMLLLTPNEPEEATRQYIVGQMQELLDELSKQFGAYRQIYVGTQPPQGRANRYRLELPLDADKTPGQVFETEGLSEMWVCWDQMSVLIGAEHSDSDRCALQLIYMPNGGSLDHTATYIGDVETYQLSAPND